MADWKGFDLSSALENGAQTGAQLAGPLQAIAAAVDTIDALLEVLQSFFIATSDPRLAAIKTLLNEIQQIIDNLQESGVHALFMVPENLNDLASNYQGGYGEFEQKFVNSLFDTQDSERPQIGSNGSLGGLFIFTGSGTSSGIINHLAKILRTTNQNFNLRYPSPVNVRALPANEQGVPMDRAFVDSFTGDETPESLLLEWEEPKFANDILLDVFAGNKFYIEVAKDIEGEELNRSQIPKQTENPVEKRQRKQGDTPKLGRNIQNPSTNSSLRIWDPLDPDDPFVEPQDTDDNTRVNFLAGSYSYHIENVKKGIENGKYYRIRSVPNDVTLEEENGQKVLKQGDLIYTDSTPSSPVFGALPDVDFSFDLPSAILNIYRVGYILRMDREIKDQQGDPVEGGGVLELMLPPSLTNQGGIQTYEFNGEGIDYFGDPLFEGTGNIVDYSTAKQEIREDLVVDPFKFDAFGGADEFVAPRNALSPNVRFRLGIDRLIEERVEKLVSVVSQNDTLFQIFQNQYSDLEEDIEDFLTSPTTLLEFLGSTGIREDIISLLRLLEGAVEQGVPPNWESINFLEDIFPEINDLFDQIFNMITTLDNALQNVLDDISDSIEGVQDRLEKLTAILGIIEQAIDFLELLKDLLDIDLKVLWIPPKTGGTSRFIEEFLNAGDKPTTDNDDYYSGIVLAPGGQDPTSFEPQSEAIKFIFGV